MRRFNQMMVVLSLSCGLLALPLLLRAANLLSNDGLEPPFVKYESYTDPLGRPWDLQVAQNWQKFILPEGTYQNGKRLRFFSASDWAAFNGSGFVEKRDGANAQVWWSSELFDSGIYQQISGLTVGEIYGFQAGILQVFETTISKTNGKMFRSVGIDPYGGNDPTAPTVLWSPEDSLDVDWFYPGIGAEAKAVTMTVFVRVRSPNEASTPNSNQVWVDDTFLDLAPTTSLTLSKNSPTEVKAMWQGTPRSGFQLKGYEAQYRKITETTWTNLQLVDSSNDFSLATSQVFSGEKGIEYVVRARTWHEQIGGDSHEVPGPWAEKTIALGGHISGRVLDNRAEPFGGLIVQASPILSKTAGPQGNYSLVTGVGSFSLTVKGGGSWTTPQAVRAVVPDDETTLPLTITLRPADDIIQNGDFESSSLAPWSHTISQPTFITTNQRSGQQSLCLTGPASLTQTGLISAMFRPTLSFWYQVQSGDGADLLTAEVLGTSDLTPTNRFTTTTVSNTWQHAWLDLNLTEVYSGSVGVRFILNKVGPTPATVCLDEISLGGARRTYQLYLPVVVK